MVEISVIMPVYNCEEYLNESIDSILNQSFENFEFICVDDGSTDNSFNILQDYSKKDSRMEVFHQENKGGGTARNFALEKAKGKYLLFIDSDDILYSNALKETYELIKEKDVDFLLFKAIDYNCDTDEYYEEDYFTMNRIYEIVQNSIFSYEDIGDLIFNMSATPWGKLYNFDFIRKCGAQFAEGIIFHDNLFFWDMLFASEKIYFYNETLYVRREHSTSIQGSKDKRFLNIFIALKGIESMFIKYNNLEKYKEYLYNWEISLLNYRLFQIQKEYKNIFLDQFKDFLNNINKFEGNSDWIMLLNDNNKKIYENVLLSESVNEFNLSMENYKLSEELSNLKYQKDLLNKQLHDFEEKNITLKNENKKFRKNNSVLKKENKKLKMNNKNLKNKNNKLKNKLNNANKFNEELLNSTSWKITKPLRKLKNYSLHFKI